MAEAATQIECSPVELTEQERLFFSRVAIKLVDSSLSLEDGCRAVLAEDRLIYNRLRRLGSYDRAYLEKKISHRVFAGVHMREASL